MNKNYRLGVIGFAHMHITDMVTRFNALPNVEWIGFADTVPAVPPLSSKPANRFSNLANACEVTGCDNVYGNFHEMLEPL